MNSSTYGVPNWLWAVGAVGALATGLVLYSGGRRTAREERARERRWR